MPAALAKGHVLAGVWSAAPLKPACYMVPLRSGTVPHADPCPHVQGTHMPAGRATNTP